jgi:polynucleotide 5'-kinase involved in rRNA processing
MAFAKKCKYGCGQLIVWNDVEGKFYEQATNEQHTKDRCAEAQKGSGIISSYQKPKQQTTFSDQKSEDIKAAQKERREQHRELIITMKNLTKAILALTTKDSNQTVGTLMDEIGFEQYREDQSSFQDEVV